MRGRKKSPIIYFVIPCFNEEEVLEETYKRLEEKILKLAKTRKISAKSRVVFVDDGSRDRTWEMIEKFRGKAIGIKLAKNVGHQNALLAGLMYAKDFCDATISLDADLQDDVEVIDEFIEKFKGGAEVVFGVRKDRKKDLKFKRGSATVFYKLMKVLGAGTIEDSADYRLLSKVAMEELGKYNEVNVFLRGIIPKIGLKTDIVYYSRKERFAGESKYPLKKMINFALDGITGFSIRPLRIIFLVGLGIFMISILMVGYIFFVKIKGEAVSGWAFTVMSIWLLGGIQVLALGVIGEYVGKTYLETKKRPRYMIEKIKKN